MRLSTARSAAFVNLRDTNLASDQGVAYFRHCTFESEESGRVFFRLLKRAAERMGDPFPQARAWGYRLSSAKGGLCSASSFRLAVCGQVIRDGHWSAVVAAGARWLWRKTHLERFLTMQRRSF